MNFEEFLTPQGENEKKSELTVSDSQVDEIQKDADEDNPEIDLDVQKAVVESLAADKAEQDEMISRLRKENSALQSEIANLKQKLAEQNEALSKVGDVLAKNAETEGSNKVALLDRDTELPDRFPGETYDQVLDALKEARDRAEAEGRIRKAQVLESVLVANEPTGNLAKKRAALEKFFNDNQNILSGPVIAELEKYGISHKKGEEYLLPSEILKRTY